MPIPKPQAPTVGVIAVKLMLPQPAAVGGLQSSCFRHGLSGSEQFQSIGRVKCTHIEGFQQPAIEKAIAQVRQGCRGIGLPALIALGRSKGHTIETIPCIFNYDTTGPTLKLIMGRRDP